MTVDIWESVTRVWTICVPRDRQRFMERDKGVHSITDPRADCSGPLHATDSWNFGTLIYEIFNGAFSNAEQLNNKGVIPQVRILFNDVSKE